MLLHRIAATTSIAWIMTTVTASGNLVPASDQPDDAQVAHQDSTRYSIRIVPHDTATDEHMPVYSPDSFTEVDKHPVPVRTIAPDYPDSARILGVEGMVWIKCLIDTSGNVRKATILKSEHEIFNEPAIRCIRLWKFTPAILRGNKVAVWATVPIKFRR